MWIPQGRRFVRGYDWQGVSIREGSCTRVSESKAPLIYPARAMLAQAEGFERETTRNMLGFNLGHPRATFEARLSFLVATKPANCHTGVLFCVTFCDIRGPRILGRQSEVF